MNKQQAITALNELKTLRSKEYSKARAALREKQAGVAHEILLTLNTEYEKVLRDIQQQMPIQDEEVNALRDELKKFNSKISDLQAQIDIQLGRIKNTTKNPSDKEAKNVKAQEEMKNEVKATENQGLDDSQGDALSDERETFFRKQRTEAAKSSVKNTTQNIA